MNIEKIRNNRNEKIGKQIEYYKEIPSTHIYAKQIASEKENDGKVILAEVQTAGIGTKGRNWYTGSGKNIALSLILKPECKIEKLEGLTIKVAQIIKDVIKEKYDCNLEIKMPNDLMVDGKKICGILVEVNTIGEKINYLIISFGFNVNEDDFSKETKQIATSLKIEKGKTFKREEIILNILEKIEKEIELIN